MTSDEPGVTRRRFVQGTATAGAASLAGCNILGGSGGEGTLEVLHAWSGGDGAEAAEALVSAFKEEHPDMETDIGTVSGGANQGLDTVISNRLSNDNPPSSFQNWPGKNLQKYEGALGDIGDVWEENGFEDAHIEEAVDLHQLNDTFVAVPLGSHRLNNLFYNVSVVEEAGVDPDAIDSVDALLDALETVSTETDYIPMTQGLAGGPWTTIQLFAAVMLGQEGFQPYMDFIEGNGDESAVRATFETLATIHENYISDDAASVDLTASNNNIINGEAAFIHQGNWAAGAFRNASDFEYETDWGANAFPGTENMYTLHFDSFLYPGNNPTPEMSRTWLSFVGSETAQIEFNRLKGSIPTRTDVDMSEFGPYLQDAAEDFANAEHRPPTLYHGLAVPSGVISDMEDVISENFMGPYDVDAATSGFMDAV